MATLLSKVCEQNTNKTNVPRGRGASPDQQRSEDLSQGVRVQAVAGLRLGDLGQVCEEVLQGEAVMKRDRGGALQDQAHLAVMASGHGTIWKRAVKQP